VSPPADACGEFAPDVTGARDWEAVGLLADACCEYAPGETIALGKAPAWPLCCGEKETLGPCEGGVFPPLDLGLRVPVTRRQV